MEPYKGKMIQLPDPDAEWVCPSCDGTFIGVMYDPECFHCEEPLGTSVSKQFNKYKDQPHGWIQWKGTDVCMDVHCKCGALLHIDDDFVYYIQCPYCDTIYAVSGYVQFVELTTTEQIEAASMNPSLHILEADDEDMELN